jgi:hypothetical protein
LKLNNIDAMGTLQNDFIIDIEELPKELQDIIKNGLQTQIIQEAELVKNDMPGNYLSYLDREIEKAGASMQRMIEESGRDGALLANISKVYVWNKERRKTLYNLKETYLRDNEQAVKQPQPEVQITAHEPQQITLPKSLNTLRAKMYFLKALDDGLICLSNGKYSKGVGVTKALLAYFLRCVYNGGGFPEKELSLLFGESRLGKAVSQLMDNKTGGGKPKGYERVDRLFE